MLPSAVGFLGVMKNKIRLLQVVARECGYVTSHGINWVWIEAIPTEPEAKLLLEFIEAFGLDHRGIYPPVPPDQQGYAIRYR